MSGGLYLIQGDDQLVAMIEQPYNSPSLLQDLLVKYPNLLSFNHSDTNKTRNWLVIERPTGIVAEESSLDQWSLNHLFLDQQAIPTLVAVKHNEEINSRRELIGHLIDYAANISIYWSVDSILTQFEANCREVDRDPEHILREFLGENGNEEQFWQQLKTNIQAGKLRLIFVADDISSELQRVVEFLNKQMDPGEILALELTQYTTETDDLKTLVAKVIGLTAEAQQKKSSTTRERKQWDQYSFFQEYQTRYGEEETNLVTRIYKWLQSQKPMVEVEWITGDIYGGLSAKIKDNQDNKHEMFFLGIDGRLQISSEYYAQLAPFNQEQEWLALRNQFSSIGLALPTDATEKRFPNFQLSTLSGEELAIEQFLKTFAWVIDKVIIL